MSKETTEMWSRGLSLLPRNGEEDVEAATALWQVSSWSSSCMLSSAPPTASLPISPHLNHPSSLLSCWPWLTFPHQLHWGGGSRYCSQVSAPAFGGASWTTNTCSPQPAPLTAQPAVTEASGGAISVPGLSSIGLVADAQPIWTSQPFTAHWAAPSIRKPKRHGCGPLEREAAEDHSSAGLLNMTESPKTVDGLAFSKQLQKFTILLPPPRTFGSPRASCLQRSQGRGCALASQAAMHKAHWVELSSLKRWQSTP